MAHERGYVSVVGGYDAGPAVLADAEETGRLLAERGIVVVTGGRGGVSEAASRGAASADGTTLGILPETDRSRANPHLSIAVTTGLGLTRNALVAMNGDVVIAFDGGYGTLSEVSHALLAGTPVIGVGTWDLRRRGRPDGRITRFATPAEAVAATMELLRQRRPG